MKMKLKDVLKKVAAIPEFEITGHEIKRDMNILYIFETDNDELLNKVKNNTLNAVERNFIINTVSEYFETVAKIDQKFWKYSVANVIIGFINMGDEDYLPSNLLNDKIWEKCFKKSHKTGEKEFSPTYLRGLSFEDQKNLITDYSEFFDFIWGNDFRNNRSIDIMHLLYVPQLGEENNPNIVFEDGITRLDEQEIASSFKNKLRKILSFK